MKLLSRNLKHGVRHEYIARKLGMRKLYYVYKNKFPHYLAEVEPNLWTTNIHRLSQLLY